MLDNYTPNSEQIKQLDLIFKFFNNLENSGVHVSVHGGYGLDALYGRLTRDHRDLDFTLLEKDKTLILQQIGELGLSLLEK